MHVVKCHSARAEATPKVAPVAAQNTIKLCPHEDTNLRAAIFLTCSLYRPVARKAPVGDSASRYGCTELSPRPIFGGPGVLPRENFEILCAKSRNFVHSCSSKSCIIGPTRAQA